MKVNHEVKLKNTPEYAAVLRNVRIDQGMNQTELADKLGISPMGLSHYERGARTPNIERLDEWARFLGYEVEITLVESHSLKK